MAAALDPEDPLVCVVGLGGVGSHCAHALVRAGVGRLRLVDFDRVSLSSLNRHAVATRRDVGVPKVVACAEHFRAIMPECQIEAHDAMFTATASDNLLGAARDGSLQSACGPRVVIDCIDDISTKADLLTECISRGIPVLSALGSGAKSDATSLCVARGLEDIENDPLATKLRKVFSTCSVDLSEVTFVYSTQKPQRKLLPLSEEQRAAPEEFGNVANFRLRVIPVMGTQPAMEGIVLAMQTLAELGLGHRYCPRQMAAPRRAMVERYLEALRRREASRIGGRTCRLDVTAAEATFLVQEVWRSRSALGGPGIATTAGRDLTLARWDPELPLDAGNIILVNEKQALAHTSPAGVEAETRERIETTLRWVKACLRPPSVADLSLDSQMDPENSGVASSLPISDPPHGPRSHVGKSGEPPLEEDAAEEAALISEQLSRSSAFFGTAGQASVRSAFVIVVGLGSVGSAAASMLARAGMRRMRLIDGRLCSRGSCHAIACAADADVHKVEACRSRFREVFPSCDIETVACHFESANGAHMFAAASDGQKPDLILDCTSNIQLKQTLIRAATDAGVRVVTVVGTGAADPTRITVATLKDVYSSPAAVALRLMSQCIEQVDVVHTQESRHWMSRVEPRVSGLAKLCLGMSAAAVALCRLSGEGVEEAQPPGQIGNWKKLRYALQQKQKHQQRDEVPDALALGCLAEHVWQGRSALSGRVGTLGSGDGSSGLYLVRWDYSKPVGLGNLVLLTEEEALSHEAAAASTGSLPQTLLEALASSSANGDDGNCDGTEAGLPCHQLRVHRTIERLCRHLHEACTKSSTNISMSPSSSPPSRLVGAQWHCGPAAYMSQAAVCSTLVAAGLHLGTHGDFGRRPGRSMLVMATAAAVSGAAATLLAPSLRQVLCRFQSTCSSALSFRRPQPRCRVRGHTDKLPGSGFAGLVGDTPLIELKSLSQATGCRILAKAEFLNPGGCQKDRAALQIITAAESDGLLKPGGTIVEGTSGSTGISLSLAAAERGYRVHIVMPDDQAAEKVTLLRRFGAMVELVRPASITSPEHYVNVARRRAAELNAQPGSSGAIFADQFENLANFQAHYIGTGPEIWTQCDHHLDAFVMSAGTGGTIAGVGRFLKEVSPNVCVCLADVPGSSLYNKVAHGVLFAAEQTERSIRRHRTDTIAEGIGIDRLTANFGRGLPTHNGGYPCVDAAVRVSDQETLEMGQHLLSHEGIFVGSSAAVNCVGAVKMARKLGPGHTIVTVLCDNGLRHLTKFYNPDAWADYGLVAPQLHDKYDLSFIS